MPRGNTLDGADVVEILRQVKDPEVPVLDVVELGVVRAAEVLADRVVVRITPTYSGCPALRVIEEQIKATLHRHGFPEVQVETVFNPPWTTDWLSAEAKEKLRAYGIAPPGKAAGPELVPLGGPVRTVACPFCGSSDTTLQSSFGSTACKAIHVCRACRQPFEHFKAI
jgi:ring-1,2-phenylacetyl-CoA epoxidase subunit PaaD